MMVQRESTCLKSWGSCCCLILIAIGVTLLIKNYPILTLLIFCLLIVYFIIKIKDPNPVPPPTLPTLSTPPSLSTPPTLSTPNVTILTPTPEIKSSTF